MKEFIVSHNKKCGSSKADLSQRFDDIFKEPGAVCLCSLPSLQCGRCLPSWHRGATAIPGNTMTSSEKEGLFFTCVSYFISSERFPKTSPSTPPSGPFGQGRTMSRPSPVLSPWQEEWVPVLAWTYLASISWGQVGSGISFLSRWKEDLPKRIRLLLSRKVGGGDMRKTMALRDAKH